MLRCRCSVAHAALISSPQEPLPAVATVQASLGTAVGVPVLCGVLEGVHASLGSHIAVKMARDALVEEALAAAERPPEAGGIALEVVRSVFREVNAKVYDYGHRMAAGGQVSAKALIASCDGQRVSIGQAGEYESFLRRGEKLMPFFDRSGAAEVKQQRGGVLERFIGANSKILVDLASVAVREGDLIIVTSLAPDTGAQQVIEKALRQTSSAGEAALEIVRQSCGRASDQDVMGNPERFKTVTCFIWQIEGAAE